MATRTKKSVTGAGGDTAGTADAIATTESTTAKKTRTVKPKVRKTLDPNMYVPVRNGFHGVLVYADKYTGEHYRWDEFGDVIDMTVSTLQKVRSSQRRFFSENWFLIDDPEVIDALGVSEYYKNALTLDEFDELFTLDVDAAKERVCLLSDGQKRGVAYSAKQKIESGELSDLNMIRMLEDVLDTELIIK